MRIVVSDFSSLDGVVQAPGAPCGNCGPATAKRYR